MALYLTVAAILASGAAHVFHQRSEPLLLSVGSDAAAVATPRYLVLLVLDGARPDYFDLTPLPHMDALRARGTEFTDAISGILESETPSGHATIASGSRPDRDGILGFDWANNNDRYSLFSPDQMGTLEQLLQNSQVPTIAGLYKKAYPDAKVVAISGHKYYAAAPLGGPEADAILYYQGDPQGRYVPVAVPGHTPPAHVLDAPGVVSPTTHLADGAEDHLATKLALTVVQKMRPRALLINYPEFDWPAGHLYGGSLDPTRTSRLMQDFDTDLGRIEDAYQSAGILNQTLFVVTSDHGMMPITRFVPAATINNAIEQAGTTAPDIAPSTADYIWLADPSKSQTVATNILAAADPGVQSAYYLSTTGGQAHYIAAGKGTGDPSLESANQYLLNALLNGHEPSVVVLGKEGTTFSDPTSNWKADHGGASWDSQHVALFLAGPGIAPGQVNHSAAQLEDVAPTVLADMGVTPTGMAGHVLTDALVRPSREAQQARGDEIQWLGPVVNALQEADVLAPPA